MIDADAPRDDSTILVRGRHLSMRRHGSREYASRGRGTALVIIASSPGDELVLVEAYSAVLRAPVVDLPSDWVPAQDRPVSDAALLRAARVRLSETTGYLAASWRREVIGPTAPALGDEMATWYRARGLERAGQPAGAAAAPRVHHCTRDSFDGLLTARRAAGVIVNPRVYAAAWLCWGR